MRERKPTDDTYLRLIEDLGEIGNRQQTKAWLRKTADLYGLVNIAYLGVNIPKIAEIDAYIAVTYSDDWIDHYRRRGYVKLDPVLEMGFLSIVPVDWRCFDRSSAKGRDFFRHADAFNVGRQGLTFPIRGRLGERALLSITSNESEAAWERRAPSCMRDFQVLAFHVHQTILRAERVVYDAVALSPRERECLKWVARGKTVSETAIILALSDRTVRFHLDLARHKLNATNVAHAVAKALIMGLILAP
jgi:DNA-binding CsgD family transcriptional regulator